MGRDKALLPWPPAPLDLAAVPGQTLLTASIRALHPFAQHVVVVAGENINALAPLVSTCSAILAHNPAPGRGQFSSLQIGLSRVLDLGYDAVILTPVDAPPLHAASLARLHAAFGQALVAGRGAVAPEHNGKHGHPLFASHMLIDAFLSAPVSSNARAVRQAHAEAITYLSIDDPLIAAEMNTPAEYAALAPLVSVQSR
jgi:molybdenum cofactor cytidylyltransferase